MQELYTVQTHNILAIIGRKEAEDLIASGDDFSSVAFITIADPSKESVADYGKFKAVLRIKFYDLEEPVGNLLPIDAKTAMQIKAFILKNKDSKFLINCEAGQSRSAGVGCAIEFLLRDAYFFPKEEHVVSYVRQHPRYFVNDFVYKMIINATEEAK